MVRVMVLVTGVNRKKYSDKMIIASGRTATSVIAANFPRLAPARKRKFQPPV